MAAAAAFACAGEPVAGTTFASRFAVHGSGDTPGRHSQTGFVAFPAALPEWVAGAAVVPGPAAEVGVAALVAFEEHEASPIESTASKEARQRRGRILRRYQRRSVPVVVNSSRDGGGNGDDGENRAGPAERRL